MGLGTGGGKDICSRLTSHVGLADCACARGPIKHQCACRKIADSALGYFPCLLWCASLMRIDDWSRTQNGYSAHSDTR